MTRELRRALEYPRHVRECGRRGRATILERHTCSHRVTRLLNIVSEVRARDVGGTKGGGALAIREEEMA